MNIFFSNLQLTKSREKRLIGVNDLVDHLSLLHGLYVERITRYNFIGIAPQMLDLTSAKCSLYRHSFSNCAVTIYTYVYGYIGLCRVSS